MNESRPAAGRVSELGREASSVLAEARQAYIAVDASSGPHVTPDLFTFTGGELWFAAAHATVKAKVLSRDDRAAIVVPSRGRAVCLTGTVQRFDPASPRDVVRAAGSLATVGAAVASYAIRNAPDLAAFGGDLLTGRLGRRLPPRRVLFRLSPDSVEVVEVLTEEPHGDPAVLAFPGPRAAPARWDPAADEALLPADLCPVPVGGVTPVALVVDEYVAPGPAAKQGILLRGTGRHVSAGRLAIEVESVVTWDGVETEAATLEDEEKTSNSS